MNQRPITIKRIVVLGGGTAGWMAANLIAKAWLPRGLDVVVVESADIGIVGVGEGSTPALKGFFEQLGLKEEQWMPECSATYKCGITFEGWSGVAGYEKYFHPFPLEIDKLIRQDFYQAVYSRKNGLKIPANPDSYFVACKLAREGRVPIPAENFPFGGIYGYHFDSALLGKFLKRFAIEKGVRSVDDTIQSVSLNEAGGIASLLGESGDTYQADFFIDCSGFKGKLIQESLSVPFEPYRSNLFNDSAIAIPSELGAIIPSETTSTAMKNGWAWKIPLTNRYGNGYVYSAEYCSADEAEKELRAHLDLLDSEVEARHLKMKVGKVKDHWSQNCLAVGLSQGFIEPLEATALMLVQVTVENFIKAYELGNFGEANRERFNQNIDGYFNGVRDYIVAHYKTTSRNDSAYWQDAANLTTLSDTLAQVLEVWTHGSKSLVPELARLKADKYYNDVSWHSLLAGMGVFSGLGAQLPEAHAKYQKSINHVNQFVRRSSLNYPSQREYLKQMQNRE